MNQTNQTDKKPANGDWRSFAEFGFFGTDFRESKTIINRLLRYHGLKLKVKTQPPNTTDQVEVWIEPIANARKEKIN